MTYPYAMNLGSFFGKDHVNLTAAAGAHGNR